MTPFLQGISLALVTAVIAITLGKYSGSLSLVLVLCAGTMIAILGLSYLKPVMDLLSRLQSLSGVDSAVLKVLIKAAGVAVITEIAQLICADAGNASLGKSIQILGAAVMLYLSVPLVERLLDLMENVMSNL